jgi:hypothetical protein
VIALRLLLLLASSASLAATLVLPRPGSFAIIGIAGLLLIVVGSGSAAADAFPFRALPFACSVAAVVLGPALLVRGSEATAVAAAAIATATQLAPLVAGKLRA